MSDKKMKVIVTFFVSLILAVALVGSSYAWMSISTAPIVSDLTLNVIADTDLLIAIDNDGVPGEWGSILNFSELPEGSVLMPVTFSASRGIFLAPRYGLDGRTDFSDPIPLTDQDGYPIASSVAADAGDADYGLLSFDLWFYTAAGDCSVALTGAAEMDEDIMGAGTFVVGEPIWNAETLSHTENGKDAEYAVRLAFVVHPNDETEETEIIIYEPNCDGGKGACEEYEIASGENETEIINYLITRTTDATGGALEGDYRIIRQRCSTFVDNDPALIDEVKYVEGEFIDDDTTLFDLKSEVAKKITLYIWLEGQDIDCTNALSGGSVLANLQFKGELPHDEPLVPE